MKKFRMNISAAKYVITAIFAMGMFSCQNDLLSPVPKTSIKAENIFNTADRVLLLVNGMYTSVKNGNFLGGRAQIYGDVRANDFLNRTSNGVTAYLVWNHTLNENSQNDVINMWTLGYQAINDINLFIDGIQDPANQEKFVAPFFPTTFSDPGNLKDQYIAEAKFLRALSYHTLLQLYAAPYTYTPPGGAPNLGVPLRLTGQTTSEGNLQARATVQEVYAQILKDLNEAEPMLPVTVSSATTRSTRAHRNAAIALKTRVYLTMGNWQGVMDEANKIVPLVAPFVATSGVAHALQANVLNTFAVPQETLETIIGFPFNANNTPGTQNQLGFYYRSSSSTAPFPGGGEFSLNNAGTGITANTTLWPASDARRTNFVYAVGTERFLGKYPSGTPYTDKAQVLRWAEVMLNLAEARARQVGGVDAQALALLNAVRTRSGSPAWAPADNATLIDNILTERRIEFLGEGLRSMDIMRTLSSFPAKGSVGILPYTGLNYVWPIPSTERAVNTDAAQNQPLN